MVCRYSALSSAAVLDVSESRNRSLGRSAGAGGGSREYVGRMSSGSARSSLTPRSSQEKNFDTPVMTAAARYSTCCSSVSTVRIHFTSGWSWCKS